MPKYSEAELKMFAALGCVIQDDCSASRMYANAALLCFTNDLSGPAVDALRRGFITFGNTTVFRNTPEWDNLIRFNQ